MTHTLSREPWEAWYLFNPTLEVLNYKLDCILHNMVTSILDSLLYMGHTSYTQWKWCYVPLSYWDNCIVYAARIVVAMVTMAVASVVAPEWHMQIGLDFFPQVPKGLRLTDGVAAAVASAVAAVQSFEMMQVLSKQQNGVNGWLTDWWYNWGT